MKYISLFIIFGLILIPFAHGSEGHSVTVELVLNSNMLNESKYFYNPFNWNYTQNGWEIKYSENEGIGLWITKTQLTDYLISKGELPHKYYVSKILSFEIREHINITDMVYNAVNGNQSDLVVSFGEGRNIINGTIEIKSMPQNILEYRSTNTGVMIGDEILELDNYTNYIYDMEFITLGDVGNTSTYLDAYWEVVATNKTSGNEVKISETYPTTVIDSIDQIKITFRTGEMNTTAYLTGDMIIHATVLIKERKPETTFMINEIIGMFGFGGLLFVFGAYRYDREMLKGFSIAIGISLIISSIALYYIPSWRITWLPILLPVTLTMLILYYMVYVKAIDSTQHVRLEYFLIKYGDVISLVLLIVTIIEMWSGIFSNIIPPIWVR